MKKYIQYLKEELENGFNNEEVAKLTEVGFVQEDPDKYIMPDMDDMEIKIYKNADNDYSVIINGFLPGHEKVELYRKKSEDIEDAIESLNRDIDGVMMDLMRVLMRLG
jgi:hypothetical protein